jgi:hypothetical protein
MALPDIIRYFRDCYEEDNRRSIFQASVSHRLFIEGEEHLLTGFLAETPLDPDDGLEAKKAAYLHQTEKELVYCSLFILGRLGVGDEESRFICAPLLIHPAEIIEQRPHTFLKPDCGVDLVGYPGAYESAFPLERYKMFHRAGLSIIPLSYTLWRANRQRCLQAILDGLSTGSETS